MSADLSDANDSRAALKRAAEKHNGRVPDEIYMCAGACLPEFFADLEPEALKKVRMIYTLVGVAAAYQHSNRNELTRPGNGHDILGAGVDRPCQCPYTLLPTAHIFRKLKQQAATQMMISQRVKGRIVFVASFLGYTSFAGSCIYSPGKYAIRGASASPRSFVMRLKAARLELIKNRPCRLSPFRTAPTLHRSPPLHAGRYRLARLRGGAAEQA